MPPHLCVHLLKQVKTLQEDKNDLLDIAIKQPINTH